MGNLNCTLLRRSSISIPEEVHTNNNLTGNTSNNREVSSQDVVNKFVQPSDEDLSLNSYVASNFQTLESRNPTLVSVNATNTTQQESSLNLSCYSKLKVKLPDNPAFYPENFINKEPFDAKQFLNNNMEQLIKSFSNAISQDPSLSVYSFSLQEKTEGNLELFLEGSFMESSLQKTYDPTIDKEIDKLYKYSYNVNQEYDVSEVMANSKTPDEFITNMRLAVTFLILSGKLNAPAADFELGTFSPFTGDWEEKEYSNSKKPLKDFFTHDMEHFVLSEIVSTVITGLDEKVDESVDVIDSHGCYFYHADSIKMYYV